MPHQCCEFASDIIAQQTKTQTPLDAYKSGFSPTWDKCITACADLLVIAVTDVS